MQEAEGRLDTYPSPHASKGVGRGEDEEDPVVEVVEEDGRQESHGEVSNAPDDDRDRRALGPGGGWEDFGRNEPRLRQPADAKCGGGDVEDYDSGDRERERGDANVLHHQAAEDHEQQERYDERD